METYRRNDVDTRPSCWRRASLGTCRPAWSTGKWHGRPLSLDHIHATLRWDSRVLLCRTSCKGELY